MALPAAEAAGRAPWAESATPPHGSAAAPPSESGSAAWRPMLSAVSTNHGELYRLHGERGLPLGDGPDLRLTIAPNLGLAAVENGDGLAVGFDLGLSWTFARLGDLALDLEGGLGLIWTSIDLGDGGDRFNFVEQIGLGVAHPLGEGLSLHAGARLIHFSNAGITSDNANATGASIHLGLSWAF